MSVWCDRIVTGGILFLILFTPFAFGSVHPWAFSIMEALLFLLVVVWMGKLLILGQASGFREQRSEVGSQRSDRLTPYVLPLTLFLVFALFQLLPMPPSLLRVLSPQTFELYSQSLPGWPKTVPYADLSRQKLAGKNTSPALLPTPDEVRRGAPVPFSQPQDYGPSPLAPSAFHLTPELWLPLSVAPALTRTDLLKFAAYAALFFLVWLYPVGNTWQLASKPFVHTGLRQVEERFSRSLVLVVLLTGLLVAATGFVQRFSWNGKILWFFVPYDWGTAMSDGVPRASGPFINPDHFANYLSLIFPIALACALFRTSITSKPLEHALRIFCPLTALLFFTGILLSLSRSGWISALLGVVILLWLSPWRVEEGMPALLKKRGAPVARVSLIIVCLLLLVSLLFVGPGGREQVDTRLGETFTQDAGLWSRTAIWKDSLAMVRDFPLFGVGLGAWPELFLRYRRAPWSSDFYRGAHNDYVELLAETGIIGFGLLAWFFVYGGKRLLQGLKKVSPKAVPLLAAIFAALGVMTFHELFDFNLQIPANAFLFTLLFALALRMAAAAVAGQRSDASNVRGEGFGVRGLERLTPNVSRLTAISVSLIGVVLAVCALRQEQIPYPYNLKEPDSVAEAKELLLSHSARASSHLSLLRLLQDKPPLSWQLSESQAALWLDPSNPYVRDLYASTLLRMGKTAEGLREITRSIVNSPSSSTHFYLSGKLLPWLSAAEQKAVEEGFKQALARGYPESLGSLAGFYAQLGRFSDRGMLYEQAALKESDGPKKADFLLNSGLAYAMARDEAKAERLFRKAIAAIPNDPRGYHQLATAIYGPGKNLTMAKEVVSEGIKNGAPPFDLYLSLAEAAEKAGSPGDSKAALNSAKVEVEKSSRKGQDPFPLYLLLADAASKAGDRDEERAALLAALNLRPRSSNTLFRLADLYLQEKNFDRAVLYFSKIANINPNSADVYYHLAVAEEGRYRFAAAEKAYRRAVELAPQNTGIQSRYEAFKTRLAESQKARVDGAMR